MKRLLRRLTPRTIPGQMWLIILISIAAVVMVGEFVQDEIRDGDYFPLGDTDRIIDAASTVAALLPTATPAERDMIVAKAVDAHLDIQLMSAKAAADLVAASAPIAPLERLAASLFPQDYELPSGGRRISVEGRAGVSLPIDLDNVLILRGLPDTLQSTDFINRITYYILAFLTLVAFFSLYARRAVTTPLARIARELNRSDGVVEEVVFEERGSDEVVSLARALNGMRTRIREMIDTRTRMLRSVSHDLRTPLTRLRLRTERLEEGELRQVMLADIDRIDRLVEETLDYLRTDASGEAAERTDIASLLQTVQADFADVGFPVTYDGPDRLAAQCKPNALIRAVTNLCDNALKFGTRATISLSRSDEAICIEVADDGPGIPSDQRKMVLEPFFKLDASRGGATGAGFGLGLSIVADIVRAHGGLIELGDNQPRGLVVRLLLPLR